MDKKLTTIIVLVTIALAIYLAGSMNLFSSITPQTQPSWRFIHGCMDKNGYPVCSSSQYNLGDLKLISSAPTFHKEKSQCLTGQKITSFGEPTGECWSLNFTFDNKKYSLKPNEEVALNEFIKVKWSGDGYVLNGEICHTISGTKQCKNLYYDYDWSTPTWSNTFTFTIIKPFLESKAIDVYTSGTIQKMITADYSVENKLTSLDGGALLRQVSTLFRADTVTREDLFKVNKGINTKTASISSTDLGDNSVRLQPFVYVNEQINDEITKINIWDKEFLITSRTLPNLEHVNYTITEYVSSQTNLDNKTKSNIIYWILGMAILIAITLYVTQKK